VALRARPDVNGFALRGWTRAIEAYSHDVILACLKVLQTQAEEHHGLNYHQVFESEGKPESLWFIEDGDGGAITALLPLDH
jgi:hypothetical protein